MKHNPDSCFHCGVELTNKAESISATCCNKQAVDKASACKEVASQFQLEWDGEIRHFCSEYCFNTANNIIKKGLDDFYRLPRTSVISQKLVNTQTAQNQVLNAQQSEFFSHERADFLKESFLFIPGLHCSSCAWVIERALKQIQGVSQVGINSLMRRVQVVFDQNRCELNKILSVLADIGYPAELLEFVELEKQRRTERKTLLKQILVAGFGSMQAMSFALVIYVSGEGQLDQASLAFFKWLGFLVATPVVFYSALPFFKGAKKAFRNKTFNMDVPIALAVILTYLASLYQAMSQGGEVYFDSVSMLVFLILLGRYLELLSRHKAQDELDSLNRSMSAFVDKKNIHGEFEKVRVSSLQVGDSIKIAVGELVPVDGVLTSEHAALDQSLVNGEFELLEKNQGQEIVSGSVVRGQAFEMTVQNTQEYSFITALQSLSMKAQTQKSTLVDEGDIAASRFVLAVLCFTVVSSALWLVFDPSRAFDAALAVLVVSCPCAFALATPAVVTRSLSVLAKEGVLLLNTDALKRLLEIDYVVFDKTGTLTDASVKLRNVYQEISEQQALQIANSLSQQSQHPLSAAIKQLTQEKVLEVEKLQLLPGLGISGVIDGQEYRLGRADFVLDETPLADDVLVLANQSGLLASFRVEEQLRPQAKALVNMLKALNIPCEILSGDSKERVVATAAQLGLQDSWQARLLPWQKLQHLETLKAQGHKVLMIGDGNNDAPILAAAEVSVSFASGANLAKSQADILLCSDNLMKLMEVRELAQQAQYILKQNKQWAVIYNLVAVPFAALGFVAPWLAAIGMSASSLLVVSNAFRIGKKQKEHKAKAGAVQWA